MKQLDKHVSILSAELPLMQSNLAALGIWMPFDCSWWQNHGIKNKLFAVVYVAVNLYFDFFDLHLLCGIGLTKTVHILFVFSLFELIWMNCGVPQIPGSLQGFVLFVVFFNQSEMQRRTHLFTDDSFKPQPKRDFKIFSWNLSREGQMSSNPCIRWLSEIRRIKTPVGWGILPRSHCK